MRSHAPLLQAAALLASLAPPPVAAAAQEAVRVPDSVAHRPGRIPDRVILTWRGDPAHGIAVTWRTSDDVAEAAGQIAPLDAGHEFLRSIRTVMATSTSLVTDLGRARYHTADFAGLEAGRRYAYRVGDGENWSPWSHFTTAGEGSGRFSFIYLGDEQNMIASLWSRMVREALRAAPDARFILHAGDLVDSAESDAQWGEWHAAAGWANAMVPSVPVAGNHDYSPPDSADRVLSTHWRPQFALPENGLPGLEETSYYLDYQGVRLIVLNSNERRAEQAPWLESVLRDNPNRWTIVSLHHPLFTAAGLGVYADSRELWGPLFDRYGVDLVLQGHEHVYARGTLSPNPDAPGAWSYPGAVMYVVSVSGPKMYRFRRAPWVQRAAEETPLFHVIVVDDDRLVFEARTATGELYDSFELVKQRGRPNRLVDRIPSGVPERLRPDSVGAAPHR